MKEDLKVVIRRVGDKYKNAPKPLKITIGQILEGKIKLSNRETSYEKNIRV
ncbi:hypothetical protein [Clostridium lundense]|uniref:hypothetical protein n=1 Tax=Clostridium lundense TaxID=319475 RepID=UPI000A5DAF42|nr:hypothetical protein [Clostridium lundense]